MPSYNEEEGAGEVDPLMEFRNQLQDIVTNSQDRLQNCGLPAGLVHGALPQLQGLQHKVLDPGPIPIAFIGQTNAGKSTLVNALLSIERCGCWCAGEVLAPPLKLPVGFIASFPQIVGWTSGRSLLGCAWGLRTTLTSHLSRFFCHGNDSWDTLAPASKIFVWGLALGGPSGQVLTKSV